MNNRADEEWREIPDANGYEASSLGRVRSIDRIVVRLTRFGLEIRQPYKGKILSPGLCKNGYLYVVCNGKSRQVRRLVASAFHPSDAAGLDAAHKNNIRTDNRAENLCWKTRADNIADQIVHGTRLRGESQNGAKLTEADVIAMRSLMGELGLGWSRLGKMFSVSRTAAKGAVTGKTWGHISKDQPARAVGAIYERSR